MSPARAIVHIVAMIQIRQHAINWLIVIVCLVYLLCSMLYCPQISQILPPVGRQSQS